MTNFDFNALGKKFTINQQLAVYAYMAAFPSKNVKTFFGYDNPFLFTASACLNISDECIGKNAAEVLAWIKNGRAACNKSIRVINDIMHVKNKNHPVYAALPYNPVFLQQLLLLLKELKRDFNNAYTDLKAAM